MAARWLTPRRLALLIGGGLLLVALIGALADPASAGAITIPNPITGIKSLVGKVVGVPISVAGKLGAVTLRQALEWLLGDLQAVISLRTIRFLTSVDLATGPALARLTAPMIVIGGFLLIVGLITSIADGYREVIAGVDTGSRVIGAAIFRVIGLAVLLASWFWLVPAAVAVANGLRDYLLGDAAVRQALGSSFRTQVFLGANPLFGLLLAIAVVGTTLLLVVMKFVIVIAFAMLYVGGPVLIGLAALPRVGSIPLSMAARSLLTLTLIPLTWTVVFVAWAGVSAGILSGVKDPGSELVKLLTGPALYLAGVTIIFGTTKKLLGLASLGVPLSFPGGRLARVGATLLLTRGVGAALAGGGAAALASSGSSGMGAGAGPGRGLPGMALGSGAANRGPAPGAAGATPAATEPAPRRMLAASSGAPAGTGPAEPAGDRSSAPRHARRAAAANAVFPVNEDGTFSVARQAPGAEEQAGALESLNARRAELGGEVSRERVEEAGRLLTGADRAAFAASANTALREGPKQAPRHFMRAVARQAASPALSGPERAAALTLGAAPPEVVRDAFASDLESFTGTPAPAAGGRRVTGPVEERAFTAEGQEELREEARRRSTQSGGGAGPEEEPPEPDEHEGR